MIELEYVDIPIQIRIILTFLSRNVLGILHLLSMVSLIGVKSSDRHAVVMSNQRVGLGFVVRNNLISRF